MTRVPTAVLCVVLSSLSAVSGYALGRGMERNSRGQFLAVETERLAKDLERQLLADGHKNLHVMTGLRPTRPGTVFKEVALLVDGGPRTTSEVKAITQHVRRACESTPGFRFMGGAAEWQAWIPEGWLTPQNMVTCWMLISPAASRI